METKNTCGLSCVDCHVMNCRTMDKAWPGFCLTTDMEEGELEAVMAKYEKPENKRLSIASAEVEYEGYLKLTRVEEIIAVSKKMGYKKLGIATCAGLIEESRILAKILRAHGFEVYSAICKVGGVEKSRIGIPAECESIGVNMCNPILQAEKLNKAGTDFNIVVGLCVGHDSLFYKYSDAMCTTMLTKDRVLGHNPAAALYGTSCYYARLLHGE